MKKNVMKAGLLALAIALVMAACASPNDPEKEIQYVNNGTGATIVRLYLDRVLDNLDDGDSIALTIGEEILVPDNYLWAGTAITNANAAQFQITYPYPRAFLDPTKDPTLATNGRVGTTAPFLNEVAPMGQYGYHPKPNPALDAVANTGNNGWGFSYGNSTPDVDDPNVWSPWLLKTAVAGTGTDGAEKIGTAVYYDNGKHADFRGPLSPTNKPTAMDISDYEYITADEFRIDMRKPIMIRPGLESNYFISRYVAAPTNPPTTSVIDRTDTRKKVLWSGLVTLRKYGTGSINSATTSGQVTQGLVEVTSDGQYFVDIFLYEATQNMKDPLTLYTGSMNGYIELDVAFTNNPQHGGTGGNHVIHTLSLVNTGTLPTVDGNAVLDSTGTVVEPKGNMLRGMYYYTPNYKGFNRPADYDTRDRATYYSTDNLNIERVSLVPGINELRLSMFSNTQFFDQR